MGVYSLAAIPAKQEALLLMQMSDMSGPCDVYIGKAAMKIVNKRDNINLLLKNDTVYLYNTVGNKVYQIDAAHWTGEFAPNIVGDIQREVDMREHPGTDQVVNGLMCHHILLDRNPKNHKDSGADFWYTSAIPAPKSFGAVLERNYFVPLKNGIPIKFQHISDRQIKSVLDTQKVQKVTVPAAFFELPPNLRRCASSQEVMFSSNSKEDIIRQMVDGMR